MELRKITRLSMLLALSIALNIMESFFPIFSGVIPGLKLGLANIITLLVLYSYSFKDALTLSILRVLIVGILRTGLFSITFFFSLSGAITSIIIMSLAKKITHLSPIGVSILGSIAHSLGQIAVAILILNNEAMLYYLPWLLLLSIPTGIITGLVSSKLINQFNKY